MSAEPLAAAAAVSAEPLAAAEAVSAAAASAVAAAAVVAGWHGWKGGVLCRLQAAAPAVPAAVWPVVLVVAAVPAAVGPVVLVVAAVADWAGGGRQR